MKPAILSGASVPQPSRSPSDDPLWLDPQRNAVLAGVFAHVTPAGALAEIMDRKRLTPRLARRRLDDRPSVHDHRVIRRLLIVDAQLDPRVALDVPVPPAAASP